MAAQSMPSRDAFIASLSCDDVSDAQALSDSFSRAVARDVDRYVSNSGRVLRVIDDVYKKHHLYIESGDT